MDLDQALHVERRGSGYRVRYAPADVASFVVPGSALDAEAHRRGETLYAPDGNALLYPSELSEGAASLLPGELRPALVWTMEVDETGEGTAVHVRNARVRSRAKLDYDGVQRALDGGSADEVLRLLREVGILRQQREVRRGGVSLQLPEQEVAKSPSGYVLSYRALFPVEGWNAQISLITGMAAAELMLTGEVGILRTVPAADPARLERFRRQARALGVPWPAPMSCPDFVRGLDANVPRPGGAARAGRGPAAGVRLHGLRPERPAARRTRRARLHVRPHHGTAPPARRPLRR
jgi:exoribonuclease R